MSSTVPGGAQGRGVGVRPVLGAGARSAAGRFTSARPRVRSSVPAGAGPERETDAQPLPAPQAAEARRGAAPGSRRPQEGPAPPHSQVLPPAHRAGRLGADRRLRHLGRVLGRPGDIPEQRPGRRRQPGRVGPQPLPGPRCHLRRVALLQPAEGRRPAEHVPRGAEGRADRPGHRDEGEAQAPGIRARHPCHAHVAGRQADHRRGPVAGGGEGQRGAGHPDHVPARRDLHVLRQRDRVDRPAACPVLPASRLRRPRLRQLEGPLRRSVGQPRRPARHVQRRVQDLRRGGRLLPQRRPLRLARQRRRVDRLLQERHGQDRPVGPRLHA